MQLRGRHISTAGSGDIAPAPGQLWSVNVTTASAGSTLTIYNSTTATNIIAVVDCGTVGSYWFGIYCEGGIHYDFTGTAKVTVGFR